MTTKHIPNLKEAVINTKISYDAQYTAAPTDRVTVQVDPDVHAELKDLSDKHSIPMYKMVSALLELAFQIDDTFASEISKQKVEISA